MAAVSATVPFTVDGKTALITGAGSGINYCFAKLLLERGCNVVIADIGLRPEAENLVQQHSSNNGSTPKAIFVKTDVTSWDQIANAFNVADDEFGGADIVCPGAGVFEPHWTNFWIPPGTGVSKDKAHGDDDIGHYALLDINLTHPIRATQLAISKWLNPSDGSKCGKVSPTNPKRVVHISSIAGQTPNFAAPMYTAAKHGLSGFIRSLAPLEQSLGIRVNGVAPGIIRTPLWTEHPEKLTLLDEKRDEWVEPEEVAAAMLECVESEEKVGGWVLEVVKDATRNVDWRNDPGPQGPGATASNAAVNVAEVFNWLAQPGWGTAP
ncbi:Putative short-chain dehydrogenase/reductase SDR, NAD(P)-binding domain superfamily [Septoria linicola]|uniref:Short-chain dehydrogenase/reductase SDR, NAD(P)-binding domain superfamily n=1 Tax=Septoria linicola TaxID=215465 RepID=A0A9Q9ATU3_9PEZI|nr:putative short-chain dehydrogenase/reductase SDR, NAD(P)-binding domain superfamily [Septoria linicola]USW52420.1 Putative short-chain dehydrogenase/reductase SDR, NAD(P)-binding domain superfamily [Septoria linicola]